MSTELALSVDDLTVRFGAVNAISDVSVAFAANGITGLIGPNGAGKTTLLNAISGFTTITTGTIRLGQRDLTHLSVQQRVRHGIVRTFQTVRLLEDQTVFVNIVVGCQRYSQPMLIEQMLSLPRERRARRRDIHACRQVMNVLGLEDVADRRVSELPYASRRLTELARALVVHPEVLLLDEPAAGFDQREREGLTQTLQRVHAQAPFMMVVVEHDVDVVRQLCSHVVALDAGRIISSGSPDAVLQDLAVRTAYFGLPDAAQSPATGTPRSGATPSD